MASLDHLEHAHSPFSAEAFQTLEAVHGMVGVLEKAILDSDPNGATAVVSDHSFATVDHQFNPAVDLVKAGLLTVAAQQQRGSKEVGVSDWKATVWSAGGSASLILKDERDSEIRAQLRNVVEGWAADPQNGIERILTGQQIKELGGDPRAVFVIDMKPGDSVGSSLGGPLVRVIPAGGTHGYAPTHPEMQASFFIAGATIKKGTDLGQIDMRNVAPTLAEFLGVALPSADLPGLSVQLHQGPRK